MSGVFDWNLSLSDGLILGIVGAACIYLAVQVYRPRAEGGTSGIWLLALRAAALVLVVLLLMEPILGLTVKRQRKPLVAILLDTSESMRGEDSGRARSELALEALSPEVRNRLRRDARVVWYSFSDVLGSLTRADLDSLRWDGPATDVAGALDGLREASSGDGLVAALLVSDGGHNLGGHPERAAEDLGVPVYAVGVGNPEPPRDLALVSSAIDPVAYVGQELGIEIGLRASGYEGAQDLLVVEEAGRRLVAHPVRLLEGEQSAVVKVKPETPGRHVYRVSIAPREGERSSANNAVMVFTEILESRIRVLALAGGPSPDFAYLRRLLGDDPNVEVAATVADGLAGTLRRARESLADLADRDLVILFDVPREVLTGGAEDRIAAFVDGGGALLYVAGPVGLARLGPALSGVLPVGFSRDGHPYRAERYPIRIPEPAFTHPIMRVTEDPRADRDAWAELPPLAAYCGNTGLRPGATTLVEHPAERVGDRRLPLVAVGPAGRGKSMAVTCRGFWRFGLMMWGIGGDDAVSRGFWTQALRWLVTRQDVDRVRASVDKSIYRSGEPVGFRVQVLDELLQPLEGAQVMVSVSDSAGPRETVLRDEGRGRYSGRMRGFGQGDYAFRVRADREGTDPGTCTGRFVVGRYSLEFEDLRMNAELLREIALRSGGAFLEPDALSDVLEDLPLSRQPETVSYRFGLWGRRWPLVLLVCLLAAEWTVRRRRGMV